MLKSDVLTPHTKNMKLMREKGERRFVEKQFFVSLTHLLIFQAKRNI